jgi:AcrR family transcriptional regulator
MVTRNQHRQRMLDAVARTMIDHPFEQLSLNGIAEQSGVSLWALRYNFDNCERLFRAVAQRLIDQVIDAAIYRAPSRSAVVDSIQDYARFVADLVRSNDYRSLLYLVIRNGRHHEWLRQAYEERVVGGICGTLEAVIRRSGESHGINVLLREHAARRFHRRIETELALSTLLLAPVDREPVDVDKLLREVARETFEATYVFEWGSASAA